MSDDLVRRRSKKKHKHERKHKSDKRGRDDHNSDASEDEEQPPLPPQVHAEPWHCMQFALIDGINGYGEDTPDSRVLRGLAPSSAPGVVDMSNYTHLTHKSQVLDRSYAELCDEARLSARSAELSCDPGRRRRQRE